MGMGVDFGRTCKTEDLAPTVHVNDGEGITVRFWPEARPGSGTGPAARRALLPSGGRYGPVYCSVPPMAMQTGWVPTATVFSFSAWTRMPPRVSRAPVVPSTRMAETRLPS
jgi:hypothetical protein